MKTERDDVLFIFICNDPVEEDTQSKQEYKNHIAKDAGDPRLSNLSDPEENDKTHYNVEQKDYDSHPKQSNHLAFIVFQPSYLIVISVLQVIDERVSEAQQNLAGSDEVAKSSDIFCNILFVRFVSGAVSLDKQTEIYNKKESEQKIYSVNGTEQSK